MKLLSALVSLWLFGATPYLGFAGPTSLFVGSGSAAPAAQTVQPQATPSMPPKNWAQDAAGREIEIILHPGSYVRYRQRTIDAKGDELRDVIEAKDGTVARLVMRDNRPLTPEEDQAERDRLNSLIDHPSDFARHTRNAESGKKLAVELIRVMPDAMIYTFAADQTPCSASSAPQVVLDYVPDPKFSPPTTASEALSGLRGRIWIDAKSKIIVRMTGDIFQGVNFGWGMLAHIYPGGKVEIDQSAVVGDRWNLTSFHEHVTVKALMLKTIKVNTEVRSLDFQPLPEEISYQNAIHVLLDTPLPR